MKFLKLDTSDTFEARAGNAYVEIPDDELSNPDTIPAAGLITSIFDGEYLEIFDEQTMYTCSPIASLHSAAPNIILKRYRKLMKVSDLDLLSEVSEVIKAARE